MAIHSRVVTLLDERAADATAGAIEKRFATAGAQAGVEFREGFAKSVPSSYMSTFADSLAKGMTDPIKRQFKSAGNTAAKELSAGFAESIPAEHMSEFVNAFANSIAPKMNAAGRKSGESFSGAFMSQAAQSMPGGWLFKAASKYDGEAAKAGAVIGKTFGMAITAAAGGLLAAGAYTLFKGFERYEAIDAAQNRLQNLNRTLEANGKAGINVAAVMKTVNDVVLDTPFALDKAFSIATRALASNTGDLKRFMTDVADTAGFSQTPIENIGEAFLKVANKGKLSMRELQNELRNLPVQAWLSDTLHKTGPEIAKMIHDGQIGLADLMTTIEQHAGGFAKAAGNTVAGAVENLKTSIGRLGANFLGDIFGQPAEKGNQLVEVLKTLRQRIDEVGAWVQAHKDEIRDMFHEAGDAAKDLATFIGNVKSQIDDIPGGIKTVVGAFIAWKAIEGVVGLQTALKGLGTTLETTLPAQAATGAARMTAALGPLAALVASIELFTGGKPGDYVGTAPKSPGGAAQRGDWGTSFFGKAWPTIRDRLVNPTENLFTQPGTPTPYLTGGDGSPSNQTPTGFTLMRMPNGAIIPVRTGNISDAPGTPDGAAPAGGDIQDPTGSAKKGPRLPQAPQVPYDTSLPAGFANLPQTAELYSAESSFMEQRHKVAEAQARVNQLEHDNTATADDILKAKNDVIESTRAQNEAELRLYDAANKKLKNAASDMKDIGAKLDADFGISKGLSGIVENLIKVVADFAVAPMEGRLNAITNADPHKGGSGIMGMLGAQGVFGPRFTGLLDDSTSTLGPGGVQPGGAGSGAYPGDAALLANVPRGSYQWGGGDLSKGLTDCSGAVTDLVNILDTGSTTPGHDAATGSEAQWLTQRGFLPTNVPMPGTFQVGLNADHTQATLPGGTQFNWGNNADAANRGIAPNSGGAWMPGFTQHFYRPAGAVMGGDGASVADYAGGLGSGVSGPGFPIPLPVTIVGGAGAAAATAGAGSGSPGSGPTPPTGPPAPSGAGGPVAGSAAALGGGGLTVTGNPALGGPTVGGDPGLTAPGLTNPAAPGAGAPGGIPGGAPGSPSLTGPGGGAPRGGFPQGLPMGGGGPAADVTRIGGGDAIQGTGNGGIGIADGSLLGGAIGAAGAGAGMMAPGLGQLASGAMKLANRGIQYVSQVGGILADGALDTLLPFGGSKLAQNSWLTKIIGGVAGAHPDLPNAAGDKNKKDQHGQQGPKAEAVLGGGQDPNAGQQQGGQGGGDVTNHITVNNQRATEDGTGRDIAYSLQNQYQGTLS